MIGIDLGSRSIKIVQMDGDEITGTGIYDTISFYRRYRTEGAGKLRLDLEELGFAGHDSMTATGYGKIMVRVEGAVNLPEIQAHVTGAVYQTGQHDFTLLDIGGQDTKVVKVRSGRVEDFMTNDRCAASSGRYLENMASILDLTLEQLSSYDENPAELDSTCAIFGETEIIARIVEGYSTSALAAGVNYALYRRCAAMLDKLSSDVIIMAGGVAKNKALGNIIARETGCIIVGLSEPQLNGAIGCCCYGRERLAGVGS